MSDGKRTNVLLRLFTKKDRAAVEHLLHNVWGADHDALAYYRYGVPVDDGERYMHTVVAEYDEQIVGMGSVWTKLVHPHTAYIGIHVDPQHKHMASDQLCGSVWLRSASRASAYRCKPPPAKISSERSVSCTRAGSTKRSAPTNQHSICKHFMLPN